MTNSFLIALRGYDIGQVDDALAMADQALASGSESARAEAGRTLRSLSFRTRLRGYARHQVDRAVRDRLAALDRG
ncbi:hypothetical protein SAMN05421812_107198 [Asanoa hainanensis]|uniref:DivIVA domain-containing protein n=2 Tax=Asanoa hainanensis TaxID=560556 RepID=A0A239N4J1_9ACTN|nr:hypothetical protein SAMN05421812_107198 [Asanoa hainanensis]